MGTGYNLAWILSVVLRRMSCWKVFVRPGLSEKVVEKVSSSSSMSDDCCQDREGLIAAPAALVEQSADTGKSVNSSIASVREVSLSWSVKGETS